MLNFLLLWFPLRFPRYSLVAWEERVGEGTSRSAIKTNDLGLLYEKTFIQLVNWFLFHLVNFVIWSFVFKNVSWRKQVVVNEESPPPPVEGVFIDSWNSCLSPQQTSMLSRKDDSFFVVADNSAVSQEAAAVARVLFLLFFIVSLSVWCPFSFLFSFGRPKVTTVRRIAVLKRNRLQFGIRRSETLTLPPIHPQGKGIVDD